MVQEANLKVRLHRARHLVLDTTQCTILLYRATKSPSLDPSRREALVRRLEAACRRGSDRI